MHNKNIIHLAIIALINLTLVGLMVHTARVGNDKAIIILILTYPILTLLNAITWLALFILKRPEAKIYKYATIGLIIAFFPAITMAIS